MEYPGMDAVRSRLDELERWQASVGPMLRQLSEDQAYRKRWMEERSSSRTRLRRNIGWAITALGGLVVAAASLVQLAHLL